MEAKAIAKTVRISALKSRLVMRLINGKNVGDALNILNNMNNKAARVIKKVLISAALLLIVVIVCVSVFVSCNGKEMLAENLEGTWTCPPTQIESGKDANVVCVRTFVVTRTPDKLEGEVQFSGLVNVTSSLTSEQGFLQAITFSASGTINAKGTWLVKDDDEITVSYDPASVVADFPAETILLPNAPFSASDSIAATYKNAIAQSIASIPRFLQASSNKSQTVSSTVSSISAVPALEIFGS